VSFPLIYSNNANTCIKNNNIPCAVSMSQSSTFNAAGTIYVPYGVFYANANASPVSGQVVADTIRLQSGASASQGGVAYREDVTAPIIGDNILIEG
jgi:hypothetical protein